MNHCQYIGMRPSSYPVASTLPVNLVGKDWFVGDIHGHFKRLSRDLDRVGFRKTQDRLICVGDLMDRGPQSEQSVEWLEQPWFFSVRGNHDDLFLKWRKLKNTPEKQMQFGEATWFKNGGRWILRTKEDVQQQLEKAILRLPYILVVPDKNGSLVAAVHSNLPTGSRWPDLMNLSPRLLEQATWNRQRTENGGSPIEGLDAVVCGHTFMTHPAWIGHFYHIDTGGWRRDGHFSIISIDQILSDSRRNRS